MRKAKHHDTHRWYMVGGDYDPVHRACADCGIGSVSITGKSTSYYDLEGISLSRLPKCSKPEKKND